MTYKNIRFEKLSYIIMTEKIFKIVLDDQNKAKVKLDSNSFLSDLRKKLKEKIAQEQWKISFRKRPLKWIKNYWS